LPLKKYIKYCLAFLAVAAAFSCKKENKNPQWDIEVLAPIFKLSLTVDHILADSITQVSPEGAVTIVYSTNAYNPPVDSLFQFADTLITTAGSVPVPVVLNPGQPIYSSNQTVSLDIPNGVKLKMAIIKHGYAHLVARNKLHTKVVYDFIIPRATLGTDTFKVKETIDSATAAGPATIDKLYDISGYTIDLTGLLGDKFNTLLYNVVAKTDPSGPSITTAANDTIYFIETGFTDLVPLYGRGYLGQGTTSVTNESTDVGFAQLIHGGTIELDSVSASIAIRNYIGADVQATIPSFLSVNDRTGTTVALNAPTLINHPLNINRASETGPPVSPINSTVYTASFNQTNSNVTSFLENIPERLTYSLNINFNPLGNVSGYNDFVYTDSLFGATVNLNFPLRFGANQLLFIDTVNAEIKDTGSFDNIGSGEFSIVAYNGFPWQFQLQMSVLDEWNNVTDTLLVPGTIAPAPLNASMRATTKERSVLKFTVDGSRKSRILKSKKMIVMGRFTTQAYPQPLQVYSDYSLDLKLIGDVIYHIR
jgi:hypothetical protein